MQVNATAARQEFLDVQQPPPAATQPSSHVNAPSRNPLFQSIRLLEQNKFVDEATRALFVELLLHGANTNLVTHVRFLLEFDSSGIIFPSARISVIEPDMYHTTLHQFRAFLESAPPQPQLP
jgi:hypothetical protein